MITEYHDCEYQKNKTLCKIHVKIFGLRKVEVSFFNSLQIYDDLFCYKKHPLTLYTDRS